jgi:S1-C subfamily serine protease
MPDFAFEGPGVRVQQVVPGSAAEEAGVMAGDVLIAFDGEAVTDLRTLSNMLGARLAGDEVELTVRREGEDVTLRAVLGVR